ncbi:MAG TPA: hypothetical protein VFE62_14185 [Gemmataceae bacterium]|nr:hypothetical protein [Gemmataceae bacterium]
MCNHRLSTGMRNGQNRRDGARLVEQVLAEYLRAWGLRDPKTIADHCSRWSEQTAPAQGEPDVSHWSQAALQHAMRDIDFWIEQLTRLAVPAHANSSAHRGLVALAMQGALKDCPETFLNADHVPAELLQRLSKQAATPVAPPADGDTQMSGPPLEELLPEIQSTRSHIYAVFIRLIGGQ